MVSGYHAANGGLPETGSRAIDPPYDDPDGECTVCNADGWVGEDLISVGAVLVCEGGECLHEYAEALSDENTGLKHELTRLRAKAA